MALLGERPGMMAKVFGAGMLFIGLLLQTIWIVTAAHGPHALGVAFFVACNVTLGALLLTEGRRG